MTRQKDAELAYSQIAALQQRAQDAAARRATLEESLMALAQRSESCRAEIAAIRQAKSDSQTEIAQKEKAIREATEQRLERQQAETAALGRARTSSDSREEMGREMARLAERKAAAETEYDQTVAKLWDEYQLSVSQAENLCVEFESLTALLRAQVAEPAGKIRALGSVNVSAIEEYKEVKARYDALDASGDRCGGKPPRADPHDLQAFGTDAGDLLRQLPRHQRKLSAAYLPSCSAAAKPAFCWRMKGRCALLRHRHPGGTAGQGDQESGSAFRR